MGVSPRVAAAHCAFDPSRVSAYPEMFYEGLLKPPILDRFALAHVPASQLFFAHGSFNLAERLIHKLFLPSAMLGVGPQFNEIPSEFVATGGSYTTIPFEPPLSTFPFEKMIRHVRSARFSVLYIDNPNNPTGAAIDLGIIRQLLMAAAENDTNVLIDEAYGDFVPDNGSAIHLINDFPNLAVIRSFSKGLGLAAERIGYLFLSKEIADEYRKLDVPFEPTLYAATLAAVTTQDVTFHEAIRAQVQFEKKMIASALTEAGYFVLPTHDSVSILSIHRPDRDVVEDLFSIGISVEPGSEFKQTNPAWDDSYCRIRMPKSGLEQVFCDRLKNITR